MGPTGFPGTNVFASGRGLFELVLPLVNELDPDRSLSLWSSTLRAPALGSPCMGQVNCGRGWSGAKKYSSPFSVKPEYWLSMEELRPRGAVCGIEIDVCAAWKGVWNGGPKGGKALDCGLLFGPLAAATTFSRPGDDDSPG